MRAYEFLTEAWSKKYKSSINCSHPKGFSQKAHCAGKKKHNESVEMESICPDCGMCETHGNHMMEVKQRLDAKCWKGKHKEGTKIKGGVRVNNCVPNESVAEGSLEANTPNPVVVVQDLKGKILDKVNLSMAVQKYKLGNPQDIKNQLAHQNYTQIGNYIIVSPMSGQPQDEATGGATETQVYQYMIRQAPEFMKTAITADVKRAIAKAMSYGSQISVPDLASYAYGILKTNDLDEGAELKQAKRAYNQAAKTAKKEDMDEAGSAAQQAAIAINMKKHHKKPKNEDVYTEEELNLLFDSLEEMFDAMGIHEDNYDAFTDENILSEAAAWQKKSGKNKNGGLNKKGVASYRREHPGSKLQTAVTTKPSKLKKGSKASKRRKSFCARMKGMKKSRTGAKTKRDPNSRINKSLRKWNC